MKNTLAVFALALGFNLNAHAQQRVAINADIASVGENVRFTINADGSYEEVSTHIFQALTDKGRVDASLRQIQFNPSKEALKITEASLIQGTTVTPVPLKKISSKAIQTSKIGLDNIQQLTIPYEGVQVGNQVRYSYYRRAKTPTLAGQVDLSFFYGLVFPEANSRVEIRSKIPLDLQTQDPDKKLQISDRQDGPWHIIDISTREMIYSPLDLSAEKVLSNWDETKKVPRVFVTARQSWGELNKIFQAKMAGSFATKLPQKVQAFVATQKNLPKEKVISNTRSWISQNVTYSGRWTDTNSDWLPRSVDKIILTRVGDCKDFSVLLVRMLREVGIKADFAIVNVGNLNPLATWMMAPIDEKNIRPTMSYFNHAIVRVYLDSRYIFLDPTVNLSQSSHSDFHLHNKPSFTFAETETYKKILITDLRESKIENTLTPAIGGFQIRSKLKFEGPLAQFIQSVRFGSKAESLPSVLALFSGFPAVEGARISAAPPADRSLSQVTFEIEGIVSRMIKYDLAGAVLYNQLGSIGGLAITTVETGSFYPVLDFPAKLRTTTVIPEYFAKKENSADCVTMGPIVRYKRIVENVMGKVSINEDTRFDIADKTMTEKEQHIYAVHLREIGTCTRIALELEKIQPGSTSQTSFESSIDPNPNRTPKLKPENFAEDFRQEWRRLMSLIKRYPNESAYKVDLGRIYAQKSMINSSTHIAEYLEEARDLIEESVRMNPGDPIARMALGLNLLLRNDIPGAENVLSELQKIAPESHESHYLEAYIFDDKKDYVRAANHFGKAALSATNKETKIRATEGQIFALCRQSRETCKQSKPLIQSFLSGDIDPWQTHNMATLLFDNGDYREVIEIERKVIKTMDFGNAKGTLRDALAALAFETLRDPSILHPDKWAAKSAEIEALLNEANSLDPHQKDVNVQRTTAWYLLKKAQQREDGATLLQAHIVIQSLKKISSSPEVYRLVESEYNRLTNIFANKGRMPANVPNPRFGVAHAKYVVGIATPEGKAFDPRATAHFGPHFDKALHTCLPKGGRQIEAVLTLDEKGEIREWENQIDNSESKCVRQLMIGKIGLRPPTPQFFLWVNLRVR